MSDAVVPFTLCVADAQLDDLRERLGRTRWPERETAAGWEQGAPLQEVRRLCDYWQHEYDWRRCEAMLNGFGQYQTEIDGLGIHFLHVRSREPTAMPLLITHGWPGSVIEFNEVIGPLVDPASHGGDPHDAFHVVAPSLPGYGFSDRPATAGWGVARIADAWITLMLRLGYSHYVAQGGDWGSAVTAELAAKKPPGCLGVHLNSPFTFPDARQTADATPAEQRSLDRLATFNARGSGYSKQQSTRPQTLGYGLVDSPAAQAAWIYDKLHAWSDNDGDVSAVLTPDKILDNIMLYWLTATGASSARLYWESLETGFIPAKISLPTAVSLFPKEIFLPSRRWAESYYDNIVYWNELDRGGHFAAFEQPALFVEEMQKGFRFMRDEKLARN